MLTTTLEELRKHKACSNRYRYLCKALGGARKYGQRTAIPLLRIMETNGFADCLWALRAVMPGQEVERDEVVREAAVRFLVAAPSHPRMSVYMARGLVSAMESFQDNNMADVAKMAAGTARRMYVEAAPMAEWVATGWTELEAEQMGILRELLEGDGDGESV